MPKKYYKYVKKIFQICKKILINKKNKWHKKIKNSLTILLKKNNKMMIKLKKLKKFKNLKLVLSNLNHN